MERTPINNKAVFVTMEREFGPQPVDAIMTERGLNNHALVAASSEQLTHKMVSKARRGRWLSVNVRLKLLRALNQACGGTYALQDLFNYS